MSESLVAFNPPPRVHDSWPPDCIPIVQPRIIHIEAFHEHSPLAWTGAHGPRVDRCSGGDSLAVQGDRPCPLRLRHEHLRLDTGGKQTPTPALTPTLALTLTLTLILTLTLTLTLT